MKQESMSDIDSSATKKVS